MPRDLVALTCILVFSVFGTLIVLPLVSSLSSQDSSLTSKDLSEHDNKHQHNIDDEKTKDNNDKKKEFSIRIAHVGNSIQYYNDFSRLLRHLLLQKKYDNIIQDSCLRGGSSFVTLASKGNGMSQKFHTPTALRSDGTYDIGSLTISDLLQEQEWDYVIMNDYTQAPAREDRKIKSMEALQSIYLPLLSNSDGEISTTVIFFMTAAYREPVKDSEEIGDYDEFTSKLYTGYKEYQTMIPGSKVAPVGLAYQYLREHHFHLWKGLYAHDDFHPSPHGTLLAAYVVYATMTDTVPPLEYSYDWWKTARYMQPPEEEQLPLPTIEEANFLRHIACQICGLALNNTCLEEADDDGDEDVSHR